MTLGAARDRDTQLEEMHGDLYQNQIQRSQVWNLSDRFTYWFGNRTRILRKRYYPENIIHGIFYCELTERQFNIHAIIIRDVYENYLPFILECFNSIICHEQI
jgi:hypothetical protein